MTREEVVMLLRRQSQAAMRTTAEVLRKRQAERLAAGAPHLPAPSLAAATEQPRLLDVPLPKAVTLVVPLPPSWNSAFRVTATPTKKRRPNGERVWVGRVHLSEEAEQYHRLIDAQRRRERWPAPFRPEQMLRASGLVVMPRAGCDLDDRMKVLFDALEGHLYKDDNQVAEFGEWKRLVDGQRPRVEVTFEPIAVDKYGRAT